MATKQTILVVDDDPDDIMLLHQAINEISGQYHLSEAGDGRSALDWLKANEASLPCLIILDINMPIMDGREMLAILKQDESLKDIPVVVFTTSSNPEDVRYCKQYDVEMISKPFNISLLNDIVKKMLAHCSSKVMAG